MLALPGIAFAGDILKGVEYQTDDDFIHIKVLFGTQVDYVKHFPGSRGKITQIQIKLKGNKFDEKSQRRRETIAPDANAPSVVRDVIYEGNVRGGPYLVLRFSSVVRFVLKKEKNSTVLTVSIDRKELEIVEQANEEKAGETTPDLVDNSRADQLMAEGRKFLTKGENGDAILSFSEILSLPANKHTQDAKEYLGLARERSGQLDMAKNQYTEYLELYPKTPKTNTVRQRLMTLNARLDQMERQLKEGKRQQQAKATGRLPGELFGRVAQLGYLAALKTDDAQPELAQARVLSFLDVTRRWRDEDKDARLSFSGSNDADFQEGASRTFGSTQDDVEDEPLKGIGLEQETRIRAAFAEYKGRKNRIHAVFGRQSVNSGGVLGRFDGMLFGYEVKKNISVYGVAGAPVDYQDHNKIQVDKPMAGGRVDFNKLNENWKASLYGIQQEVDGILERRAIGGDVRYFFDKRIFYSLLDYDISYKTVNFFTSHFGWQLNAKTKFDMHVDRRRSPVMLTSNALRGLGAEEDEQLKNILTIDQLRTVLSDEQIRQRARDYTGYSELATMGLNRELATDLSMIANLTISRYDLGKAQQEDALNDGELSAEEKKEILFNPFNNKNRDITAALQLVKRNFAKPRDIVLAGVRISDSPNNRRFSGNATFRTPIKDKWWLDLRGRLMYTQQFDNPDTENDETGNSIRISPTVRTEYRFTKKMTFEMEGGADVNRSTPSTGNLGWYFFNAGYRYLF